MLRDADLAENSRVVMEKPFGNDLTSAVRLNDFLHARSVRWGAGSMPAAFKIFQTVEAATWWPRPASSPWMRR